MALSSAVFLAAGCGWSPPSGNQSAPSTCTPTDGPSADDVGQAIASLPNDEQWRETARGTTSDCRLHWVQVAATSPAADAPGQVLFFDRQTPIGTPTPQPRPYVAVVDSGTDTVTVQYQWRQGGDQACCPTGIGTVRVRAADGALEVLDPIPGP
ncbi:LppP/LprE family lipoprotein [Mycolicibacterium sediminis]|uniref:Lipoprotein LppP n=1 Tax=Mycolicibacterium sediminis TaxID=1286180 RepID=A0A7I7QXQ7_9MYCO|nr:hypothetical protein MSEDJ_47920 [Mycolicibacterium sediminis]